MINRTSLKHRVNSLLNKVGYLLVCVVFLGAANFDSAAASEKQRLGALREQIKAPEKNYFERQINKYLVLTQIK